MLHEILPVGLLACNCSVVGDDESKEAIVIDPGDTELKKLQILTEEEFAQQKEMGAVLVFDKSAIAEHITRFSLAAIKALEDLLMLLRRNAFSVVLDPENELWFGRR